MGTFPTRSSMPAATESSFKADLLHNSVRAQVAP